MEKEKEKILKGKEVKIETKEDANIASSEVFYNMWSILNSIRARPDIKVKSKSRLGNMMSSIRGKSNSDEKFEKPEPISYNCSNDLDIEGLFRSCKSEEECSPPDNLVQKRRKKKRKRNRKSKKVADKESKRMGFEETLRTSIDSNIKLPKLNAKRKVLH